MNAFRYLRSKIPAAHHEARLRDREEFFNFAKTVHHGFPNKPSCLAYDSELNLLAIGTKTGFVKIYGGAGVEFVGQHENASPVQKIFFLPNQGRIISLCEDQTLHLWEVNFRDGQSFLEHVKACSTEDRLKKISSCVLRTVEAPPALADQSPTREGAEAIRVSHALLIGTESGNIYSLDCQSFELTDFIIYQDAVIQNIPDDYKLNPGAVEAIAIHPSIPSVLLLGYNRGLIVCWDEKAASARHTYVSQQGVETLAWHQTGEKFVSAHNDGSYVVWSATESDKQISSPNIPFGPFPCKPINQIILKATRREDDDLLVFCGGMPRASYGDRHTVAVQNKTREVVFDTTSKVVDVLTLDSAEPGVEDPHTLLILCEEELVGIDLMSENWPQFRLPYLLPLHASPITAAQYVENVKEDLVGQLREAGEGQASGKFGYSKREWPIQGGRLNEETNEGNPKDLLVTGHEDGSVKFWTAGSANMALLYSLNTAKLFEGYNDPADSPEEDEEEWPPFRKVGAYDPYSDDPRFGIPRLCMDGQTGILVVGGTAGQTVVWEPNSEEKDVELTACEVKIVTDTENFVWKGHQKLELREGAVKFFPGFAPRTLVQTWPPASVTALAAQTEWGVIGIGTAHGFTLFDYIQNLPVTSQCLLNPNDMAAHASASEGVMSRMKSFKKSVRNSFRRRRRHADGDSSPVKKPKSPEPMEEAKERAGPSTEESAPKTEEAAATTSGEEKKEEEKAKTPSPKKTPEASPKRAATPDKADDDIKPVERAIEARGESPAASTEQLTSLVRCVYFGETYVLNATTLSKTFWVGTNGGAVQIHIVTLPAGEDKRTTEELKSQLAKEVQLQHRAPVLSICIVDGKDLPLGFQAPAAPVEKEDKKDAPVAPAAPTAHHDHRVVLCSEEQLKTFHLPSLKAGRHKYKLTATEGMRIRKVQHVVLRSKADAGKREAFVVVMTNEGEVLAFSNHAFRRYLKQSCIKAGDISGILSTVLTPIGEGLFLRSSSEWQRFSVASAGGVRHECSLELPEGARPPPPKTPVPEETEAKKGEGKKEEDGEAEQKPGDVSALSGDSAANTSALPTDVTVDSIRDYTQQTVETHTEKLTGGTVTVVTKTTKKLITMGENGVEETANVVSEVTREVKDLVNGEAEDEIAKLKSMAIEDANQEVSAAQ